MGEFDMNNLDFTSGADAILLPVIIISVIGFVVSLVYLIANIMIYTKAGKKWWAALIPIYNLIVLMDIANLGYKNLLFLLIPFVGALIFMIKLYLGLARKFNKGAGFAIGLLLLPFIFLPLLAFSKDDVVKEKVNNNTVSNANIEELNVVQDSSMIQNVNVDDGNQESNIGVYDTLSVNEIQNNDDALKEKSLEDSVINNNVESFENVNINNVSSNFETLDINQIFNDNDVQETLSNDNVFNLNKVDEFNASTNDSNNDILEVLSNSDIRDDSQLNNFNGKYCTNCGSEMPKIVTICPKCGTDNE